MTISGPEAWQRHFAEGCIWSDGLMLADYGMKDFVAAKRFCSICRSTQIVARFSLDVAHDPGGFYIGVYWHNGASIDVTEHYPTEHAARVAAWGIAREAAENAGGRDDA